MDQNIYNNSGFSEDFTLETPNMEGNKNSYESFNKILLIEDNPGDARLVELLLGESDLLNCKIKNVTTLSDGIKALEEDGEYAAILLDLTLPDSRGFETLERLLEKSPDNNVIVLTGLSDKSLGINAVKAGAQDFLIKGAFDSDLLAKSLRYSIERNSVLKRLEDTQRIAKIGNCSFNTVTNNFKASDQIYRILGLTPRKTVFSYQDIQDPSNPFHFLVDLIQQNLNGKESIQKDVDIKSIDGEIRSVSTTWTKSFNEDQHIVLNGIVQDITDRKKAETLAVKSQERYQDIFAKSKDAIVVSSFDRQLIDFNDATVELTGYSREELAQINADDLYKSPEVAENFIKLLKAEKAVKNFEAEILRKDGKVRFCTLTATVQESKDFYGFNTVVRDITERKQAEELRKSRDIAQRSAKMKEQFIASISHEMRTPMNAVLGMSNLMIQTELDDEQFKFIHSIKQSSEILLGIINDILEVSTLQNGKVEFEYSNFNLNELLENMVKVMEYKIKEKDLAFELNVDQDIPPVIKGDKLRLNQILYNLVGNAIKFTDNGFVKVNVIKTKELNGKIGINISVQDSGIGIPDDKKEAVFETFTRIRSKDRIYEGTGLGLSIAKSLVDQQYGKIGVISEFGNGSNFWFELDFEHGKLTEADHSVIKAEDDVINSVSKINLLLVEDHKMNQLVAKKTLEKKWPDITLTIANDGQEAVKILEENDFDIVLMDIQMPIMDGYEATNHIRQIMNRDLNALPVLAMTAHAHISKDEKFKQYGFNDFVLKPFEPKQLFHKIALYVNHKRNG